MAADLANGSGDRDAEKIAELTAVVEAVRERVRARYPQPSANGTGAGESGIVSVPVSDLMPIVHARDAAQAKIAAIGSVNPRRGGVLNDLIQAFKKTVARMLQWFVRDQISFNRESVAAIEAVIEALNDHNRILLSLAAQVNEQIAGVNRRVADVAPSLQPQFDQLNQLRSQLDGEVQELKDIRRHWAELRPEWDRKVATNEIQFLRSVADLQGALQHRTTLMESNFREIVAAQHKDFEGALERANVDIQKRLWDDLQKIRDEYERLIHRELHLIRQRAAAAHESAPLMPADQKTEAKADAPNFDYGHFAERFRGAEEYVRNNVEFYRTYFAGKENVLDIGCGRGEFLEMVQQSGVPARGIDLSQESVDLCRHKGLKAEVSDLFEYLASQPEQEFDGIFSSQVVEHLDPRMLPEMVRLCASRLRRGGVLAIETPNPECLAIFATHFYLDPTHTRPVPHPLLMFYMGEAGLGGIEVHELSPAVESIPELASLPEDFRRKFFGGLDYAIVARKL